MQEPGAGLSRLQQSSYMSPYSHAGALSSGSHPNGYDPYMNLRQQGLATLQKMGYDPKTMVEQGVNWGEDQDPFGHVMQSRFVHFIGLSSHRFMESYDEWLDQSEYEDIIRARRVIIVMKKYSLNLKRQVKYPDVIIAAFRIERMLPDRIAGTNSVFSLKQQAIVAEVKGEAVYIEVKTGRPVDIRTLGGGWPSLYNGFLSKSEETKKLQAQWEKENGEAKPTSVIESNL